MEDDFKVELKNEYFNKNHYSGLKWFILVKFDNGDELKIYCNEYSGLKSFSYGNFKSHIDEYRIKKRKEKINKIKCLIN